MTDDEVIAHRRSLAAASRKRQRTANPDAVKEARKRHEAKNPSYMRGREAQAYIRSRIVVGRCAPKFRDLVGCTLEEFMDHLEQNFTEGMSWHNRGYDGWHMDHIIPRSHFDLTDPDQMRQCFHYTNFQPLWGKANLKKWVPDLKFDANGWDNTPECG